MDFQSLATVFGSISKCYATALKLRIGKIPRDTRTIHAMNTSLFSCLVIATLFFLSLTMLKVVYLNKIN
jgi:hypothetical protein